MSHNSNTNIMEEAQQALEYWEGEGIGKVIEADIDRNDLEALAQHLKESSKLIFESEYNPNGE